MRRPLPRTAPCHPLPADTTDLCRCASRTHTPAPQPRPLSFWASLFQKSTDLESWGEATLDRRVCEAGAGVARVAKNKIFLMPTRKRRIFARSGLKSVSSKNPPLTPSAQKRLFLLKRYDKLRCARSPAGSGRPFPRGYFRHTPWPCRKAGPATPYRFSTTFACPLKSRSESGRSTFSYSRSFSGIRASLISKSSSIFTFIDLQR